MNILLVGNHSAIGLAVKKNLLDNRHDVFVAGRTPPDDQTTYIPFTAEGGLEQADSLPDALHGVVYCPGTISLKPFRSVKPDQFLNDFSINVLGAVNVLQTVQPRLKAGKVSSVVLFSSVAVQTGMPYHSSIASAKGAVEGLTRSLAAEWAPDIRVNAVAPSLTDTPLTGSLINSDEKRDLSAKRHPMQRIGTPEDIAETVLLLLTGSSWITGQVFHVNGGLGQLRQL